MTVRDKIIREVDDLPEEMLPDVLKLLREVRVRVGIARSPCAILAESALAKDWLTPEEDEAWAYLSELVDEQQDQPRPNDADRQG